MQKHLYLNHPCVTILSFQARKCAFKLPDLLTELWEVLMRSCGVPVRASQRPVSKSESGKDLPTLGKPSSKRAFKTLRASGPS